MKTASDNLFRLIKSMSPAEKRYFKRHYGSETNILTDIFDAINAQNTYDEQSIKQLLPKKVASNFKVFKFQLQQQVLQSLISSDYFSTVSSKIRLGLEQADILAARNLIDLAIKQLEKTKKLCLRYEEFPYLLDINSRELQLKYVRIYQPEDITKNAFEEHRKSLETLSELNQLTGLAKKISTLAEKWPDITQKDREQARDYRKSPLLNKVHTHAPIRSSFGISQALGNISLILGDMEKARAYFMEGAEMFTKDKLLKEHFAFYYLLALRRSLIMAMHLRDLTCAQRRLKELNEFLRQDKQYLSYQIFTLRSELQMMILTGGEYMDRQKLERKVSNLFRNYTLPDQFDVAELYFFLASTCIMYQHFDEALDYLQLLATQARTSATHFQEITAVLTLIIYYEENHLSKAKRKLTDMRQRQHYHQNSALLDEVLQFFYLLLTNKSKAVHQAKKIWTNMEKVPGDRITLQFHAISFQAWLRAIIEEKPYRTVLAEAN